jgi:DNA replication and repair protein RecF
MTVTSVRSENFRNLATQSVRLSPGFNCFLGSNGAGKTSVLESLYVLGRGRSFRSGNLDSVINSKESHFAISAGLTDLNCSNRLVTVRKSRNSQLGASLDGSACHRMSQVAELLPLQLITPDVAELVVGPPALRRQYLDWGMFHVEHSYGALLAAYNRTLKQRNAWLKTYHRALRVKNDPWSEPLGVLADRLHEMRLDYLKLLLPQIMAFKEALRLECSVAINYHKGWILTGSETTSDLLRAEAAVDLKNLTTRIGPHRANLRILVAGEEASAVLSRGQSKILAIALKLAQVALLLQRQSSHTIILFDELIAELDQERTRSVLELLVSLECQALFTAVEVSGELMDWFVKRSRMFHVEHGVIKEL